MQYTDETDTKHEKYKPITDKRIVRSEVEKMRRELEMHGLETLQADKMTFAELVEKYEKTKLIEAVYADGVKVAGRRSIKPVQTAVKALANYFGKKNVRLIKTSDLEAYKNHRLKTPIEIEVTLPYFKVFDLPFQKAAFIFSRALRDKPEFDIVTEAAGKSRTMQHDFTRDAKSDKGDFDAFFRINVKMCNPSCINNKVFEQ